jgi:hypothetical protein
MPNTLNIKHYDNGAGVDSIGMTLRPGAVSAGKVAFLKINYANMKNNRTVNFLF